MEKLIKGKRKGEIVIMKKNDQARMVLKNC